MNTKHEEMSNLIDAAIEQAGHPRTYVIYSAWPGTFEDPVNNLNEVAAEGRVRFVQSHDEFWGGSDGRDYTSNEVLINPTWLTVARLANDMIMTTLDDHHVFLEGIEYVRTDPDGVDVYEFLMGS